jgi:hypothetical protein
MIDSQGVECYRYSGDQSYSGDQMHTSCTVGGQGWPIACRPEAVGDAVWPRHALGCSYADRRMHSIMHCMLPRNCTLRLTIAACKQTRMRIHGAKVCVICDDVPLPTLRGRPVQTAAVSQARVVGPCPQQNMHAVSQTVDS